MMDDRLYRVLRIWGALELALGSLIFALTIVLITYQILARSFGNPLSWAEEAGTAMFIWMVFLGASAATKVDRHVTVTSLNGIIGVRGRAVLTHFARLVMVVASLWVAWLISPFIAIEARSTSVSLPVRIPKSFYFSIPLMACCLSMALGAILLTIRDLLRGNAEPDARLAADLLGGGVAEAGKY